MARPRDLLVMLAVAGCGGGDAPRGLPGGIVHIESAYAGADAVEVERALLAPIEGAMVGVTDVVGVRGVAGKDGVQVDVRFAVGVERERARLRVAEAVRASLGTLPAGASSPMITAGRPGRWVYAMVSPAAAARMRLQMAGPEVTRIESCGERRLTVAVELDPARMAARSVGAGRVTAALAAAQALKAIADVGAVAVDDRGTRLADVATVRLADRSLCAIAGAGGAVLLRAGLHGSDDHRGRVRADLERKLRAAGARLVAPPITAGVVELASGGDPREAIAAWAGRLDGAFALAPTGGRRVVVVWPGHDPAGAATVRAVAGAGRWTLARSPIVEATLVGDDLGALVATATGAVRVLEQAPWLAGAGCTPCDVEQALHVEVDPPRVAWVGASADEAAAAARLLRPRTVTSLIDAAVMTDVDVSVAGGAAALLDLPVRARAQAVVPLGQVARLVRVEAPTEVLHVDWRRAVTVWAQGRPGTTAATVRASLAAALPAATIVEIDPRAVEAESWRMP